MTTTTNYGYNVVEGTDQVNIQTQIAPNFTAIDSDLKDVSDAAITTATHTLAGTVHQIVRDDADRAVIRFVATADMATGDTFTVDGVSVTARLVNGEALQTGAFKINNCVECVLVGTVLNINAVNPTASTASDVSYDNTGSGLTATNVQDAIDEVKGDIPSIPATYAASAITYNNTVSGLSAADVQYAIDEVNAKIGTSEKVEVTGNGIKTRGQLFDELYALVDFTKLSPKSILVRQTAVYTVRSFDASDLKFSNAYTTNSSFNINTVELKNVASKEYSYSGSYSEVSGSVIPAGDKITIYY